MQPLDVVKYENYDTTEIFIELQRILTPIEYSIISYHLQGCRQEDIASYLKVNQATISRRLKIIKKKMHKHVPSPGCNK